MALVVLVGGYFIRSALSTTGNIKAGDCIKVVNDSVTNPEIAVVDCGSAEATHKVAKNLDDNNAKCPGDNYDEYTETGGNSKSFKLCMIPNVKAGDCIKESVIGPTTKVACGPNTAQITKVISSVDETACGDDVPFSFPEPPTTICAKPSP